MSARHPAEGSTTPVLLLTVPAAAETLALSIRSVYKLVASGALPAIRIGRATRVAVADLERLVDERRTGPREPGGMTPLDQRERLSWCGSLPATWPERRR